MFSRLIILFFSLSLMTSTAYAFDGFDVLVLGAKGGLESGNLSAFMIKPHGDDRAITCDAGTIINGLRIADEKGSLNNIFVPKNSPYTRVGYVFTHVIKAYFISHAHLDHVAGLIIGSPDDTNKNIYAFPSVLKDLENNYFNWSAWPNLANSGNAPSLNKYTYMPLQENKSYLIANTAMSVTAFPLKHGPIKSTAFLFETKGNSILCFGDTGPDIVQGSKNLENIWKAVAKKVQSGNLKAIIIETSYSNDRDDKLLFGHLTAKHLQTELKKLAAFSGGKNSLRGLPVIISHIKYTIKKGADPEVVILKELQQGNELGINYIIPQQGMYWTFKHRGSAK